jgi:hypothetical protein
LGPLQKPSAAVLSHTQAPTLLQSPCPPHVSDRVHSVQLGP